MSSVERTHRRAISVAKKRASRAKIRTWESLTQPARAAAITQLYRLDHGSLAPDYLRQLQRTIGNQAVGRLLTQGSKNAIAVNSHPMIRQKTIVNEGGGQVQGQEGLSIKDGFQMEGSAAVLQRQEAEEAPAVVVTDEDRTEYGHLRRRTAKDDNTGFDSVEDYVTYRNDHFGSRATYDAIKDIADAEWDDNATIRRMVGQSTDSTDRKKALYRWLRLEYRRQGIDTEAAIVALMRQGMTPELQAAVDRVRAAHPGLRTGGFVPRPKKNTAVGYRLGTLSEHGTGKAIDVRPQHDNPQIPRAAWRHQVALFL